MRIDLAKSPISTQTNPLQPKQTEQGSENFGKMLMDAIKEVNGAQSDATKLQNDLMANRPVETHDLLIAMERASTSMQLMMQVRNKTLEAYQELSRMQV
ncbi:MAG: flagellar hook-basal body complex protein FliE [Fimbriimonadaceae bacterium]